MKFPWETDRLSRSEFEYRPRKRRVSEGLGDKMLTRVFSPTCWSQAERDEVTRCNLRQPSSWTLEGTNTQLAFAFLCFTFARLCTNQPRSSAFSKDLSFTHGRMRLDKRAKCHEKPRPRGGPVLGICVQFVHTGEASARESERALIRVRTSKGIP